MYLYVSYITDGAELLLSYYIHNDLSAFDSQCGHSSTPNIIISTEIYTHLQQTAWAAQLANHPDHQFVNYILSGIHDGFHIGFCHCQLLQYSGQNVHIPRPSLISAYLAREQMWWYSKGFFPKGIHISSIGKNTSRESSIYNPRINDSISKERSWKILPPAWNRGRHRTPLSRS